jgi:uncharacterized protein (TIGR02996 family)
MHDEEGLLRAIRDKPDDDGLRLVYADWLEEHGEAERAEFLRVQIGLANAVGDGACDPALLDRQNELLESHQNRWLEPLRPILTKPRPLAKRRWGLLAGRRLALLPWYAEQGVVFRRGFVEHLHLPAADFLALADALFRAAPVLVSLAVSIESPADAASLFASPHLHRLRGLSLYDEVLGEDAVRRLVACCHLGRLRTLWLCSPLLDAACVRRLAGAALLGRLQELGFLTQRYLGQSEWTRGTLGDDAVSVLAGSPRCRNLALLDLGGNRISDTGAIALAASPHLGGLRQLVLRGNDISVWGLEQLRKRFGNRVRI